MIVWTKKFPLHARPLGYLRLLRARHRYFERLGLHGKVPGYHERLAALAGKHRGQRCFILGNGPSLRKMDLSKLKGEVTIGSNGLFRMFPKMGFHTTYLTMEDIEQVEDRRHELASLRGPTKLFALHNAYAIKPCADTLFFNCEAQSYHLHPRWKDIFPQFSPDFASAVFLGSTITYINLQLAFHLRCDPIYLIGVDHNYGQAFAGLPSGKVFVTDYIKGMLRESHFVDDYHKLGGSFGVPYLEAMDAAYSKARSFIEGQGMRVFNAGVDSKLDAFERVDFDSLFA